jgi:hypothetical protein
MNMTSSINGLSSKTLLRAAALKKRIEGLTRDLEHILGGTGTWTTSKAKAKAATAAEPKMRRKRRMSKAARAEQAARMRRQWAKVKAAGKNAL